MKMKALILAAILTAPSAVHAEADGCAALGMMAGVIMEKRQEGAILSDMLAIIDAQEGENMPKEFIDLSRSIAMDAFDQPQFSDPGNRENAVTTFRNQIEVACYRSL